MDPAESLFLVDVYDKWHERLIGVTVTIQSIFNKRLSPQKAS
jgi:hypothetical protein